MKIVERFRNFIKNLPFDKEDHNNVGDIVNPVIILITLIAYANVYNDPFFGVYLGCIFACLFHYSYELYQKITRTGKYELYDALAGSFSALVIALITIVLNILL